MKKFLLPFFICCISATHAQELINIPLSLEKNFDIGYNFALPVHNPAIIYGVPKYDKNWIVVVKRFYLQPWLSSFDTTLTENRNPAELAKLRTKKESAYISSLRKNTGYNIMMARNLTQGKAVMIFDKNRNNFFGDDVPEERRFDDPGLIAFKPIIITDAEMHDSSRVYKKGYILYPKFGIVDWYTVKREHRPDTTVSLRIQDLPRTGLLQLKQTYQFAVTIFTATDYIYYAPKTTAVLFAKKGDAFLRNKHYAIHDTLNIEGAQYKLLSVDSMGTVLTLQKLAGNLNPQQWEPGTAGYNFEKEDFVTGRYISFKDNQGKYTLIDFWGTWCGSCLEKFPQIKALHELTDTSKLRVISVCYDTPDKKEKAKKIIAAKRLDWIHVFDDMDDRSSSSITNNFKNYQFPHFYLIAPDGRIIKEIETEGLRDIGSEIKKTLQKNNLLR